MTTTITVSTQKLDNLIQDLRKLPGTAEAIRQQAGLLTRELIKKTPPFRDRNLDPTGFTDQAVGRRAVARDFRRAIEPVSPDDFKMPELKAAITSRRADIAQIIIRRIRKNNKLVVFPDFDPRYHSNFRDSRGRIQRDKHRATLDARAWKKHLTLLWKRVGRMKSGWAPAAMLAGEKVPAWVARHAAKPGYAHDLTKDQQTPGFLIVSVAKGVGDMRHVIYRALEGRARALQGNIRWRIRELAKKNGAASA
jgi:hypothetical protein